MSHRIWWQSAILGVAVVVSMAVGAALAVGIGDDGDSATPGATIATATNTATVPTTASDDTDAGSSSPGVSALANLPELVAQVSPSVVLIRTQGPGVAGQGSGVVIDRSGHVLTNLHVVQGATSLTVKTHDGIVAAAVLMGTDPANDLAVIRTELPSQLLVPASFGDSDAVALGEPVFAIGSPFGLEFTVTSGIISGVNRESQATSTGRPIRGVLQTDAAVNPGNSGGPLFNAAGDVIGINTAVENPIGQNFFVGIGYAVPSRTAQRFIPDMIAGATIQHAQLGVTGVSLDSTNADDAGVDVKAGVYVTTVIPGSAADRAGIRAASAIDGNGQLLSDGDVILAIEGNPIASVQELALYVDRFDVGDEVTLRVHRGGADLDVKATLLEWPS